MTRQPTVEWQVAGACNYDCSYCIQSPKYRRGRPDREQLDHAIRFYAALPGTWELKLSGGEAFAHPLFLDHIVPELIARTPHRLSVLTNLSASRDDLQRFVQLTRGRLAVFSASLHLEHVSLERFGEHVAWLAGQLDKATRLVVNQVVFPDQLDMARVSRDHIEGLGIRWFPQLYKVGGGVADYPDATALRMLIGDNPGPQQANLAPSYKGRRCWSGVEYLTVDKDGSAWSCRSAKRQKEGLLGNVYDGSARMLPSPRPCPYDICPCTVPANRGMIAGIARTIGHPP
jgi:hypothetical protein